MRAGAWAAALLAAAAAPGAAAQVEVPGRVVDAAVVPWRGGETVALLVAGRAGGAGEADGPARHLHVLDAATGRLEPLVRDLPAGAERLVRPGTAGVDGAVGVLVGALGGFEVLSVAVDGGRRTAGAFPLPRRAVRTSRGLRLASPAAHPLSGSGGDGACFATTPEAHGRRLRVLRLCAGREEPEELWMLLPGAETVTVASFLDLGEGPVLAVLTRTRLGLFVKQDLRVFALEGGRTRVGGAPLLAARTGCPLWRDVELGAVDADGDGRRDLTITCTQGLADQELRLEVFRGLGGGGLRLEGRARTATVDGSFASWTHGADLTGDGLPDLLAWRDGGGLELYAGRRRGRPLEGRPAAVHAVPGKPGDEEVRIEVEVGSEGGEVRRLAAGRRLLVGRAPDGAPAAFVLQDVEVRAPGAPSAGRMALGVVPLR